MSFTSFPTCLYASPDPETLPCACGTLFSCVLAVVVVSSDVLKTFPVYEEVEGLQVLPAESELGAFSGKFPAPRAGGSLVAVAGKGGVVRVFELEGQVIPCALVGLVWFGLVWSVVWFVCPVSFIPRYYCPSYPIPSRLVCCHLVLIYCHPIPFCSFPSYHIPSHSIPSHPISCDDHLFPTSCHPNPSHPTHFR